jgi:hypothetical protein
MAFEAQGVTLKYPAHSWSGVRCKDGGVVVAIRAADVEVDERGCRCLLWSPVIGSAEGMESASHRERFEHCSLAVRRGAAEAILAHGADAAFDAHEVVALSVVRIGNQYWGKWGAVARAEGGHRFMRPGPAQVVARAAA